MTFLKGRRNRDILRRIKTITTTTTTLNKPNPIVFGLIGSSCCLSRFYYWFSNISTTAISRSSAITATDVICSGCVGTSDIADSAVTSAKIGNSQVGT